MSPASPAQRPGAESGDTLRRDPAVVRTLDGLHRAARGDVRHAARVLPYFLYSKLTGASFMRILPPAKVKDMYLPVSRQAGRLLYALARGRPARRVVEFGASFGISTLYLAAAVRDNGGGSVVTTEIEPGKCAAATENIRRAGLADVARVLPGDALTTLPGVEGPVDLVFLDGWKDLYVPVLELLLPTLAERALVVADNTNFPDTRPYLARVRDGDDFVSAALPGGRMECSWYVGGAQSSP